MSRIANSPIKIPAGVDVKIAGSAVTVKGKLGELSQFILSGVTVAEEDNQLVFKPKKEENDAAAGTMRAITSNMVRGVHEGFERKLVMIGVGYRAKAQGDKLDITAGFSHPVQMTMPAGIKVDTPSATEIVIRGADKQKVCQVAANIRAVRPPEPYKGKGIRYAGEQIILKEGKKK